MASHAEPLRKPLANAALDVAASDPPAILPMVQDPALIRGLSLDQLTQLAGEVRHRIIDVIARNGGHFGAPLGAVDITVALLHAFELPKDRVVWDVGHQAYAWKILTGRNERFESIRQYKGLSGFLKRCESDCDSFGAGHASTSIAAALGMALARDQHKGDHKVVAVIGDGAMTGGLAYEAMNTAGHRKTDMLVVLNDNEMSISENVWALHKMLNNVITRPGYNRLKEEIESALSRHRIGDSVLNVAHRLEESVKSFLVPGMFFEQLGFRYIGPIDGHNLEELVPIMKKARDLKGPILLHVITKKGKGYSYAEKDPIKYHAAANMKIETGEMAKVDAPPAFTKVFGQTLAELGKEDKTIVAITAAMPGGTGTDIFQKAHPDRFYDIGIAEAAGVAIAAGMACDGLKPFVCIYSTFLQRAYDQIIHDVALQHLPVRFVLDRGGLVGADGPTHHGAFDLSYLRLIPEMVVLAPKDGQELRRMIRTMAEHNDGPIAMRYPRGNVAKDFDDAAGYYPLPIGKGEILQQGKRIALIGIGAMVDHFLGAAKELETALGHPVTVVNARFVKPLDLELLRSVAESHEHLFTCEDNSIVAGFGSAVHEGLEEVGIQKPVHRFGLPDRWVDHGSPKELYTEIGLMPKQLAERVLAIVGGKPDPFADG